MSPDEKKQPSALLNNNTSTHTTEDYPPNLVDFVKTLPKVELHAHLNGCIRESTLLELAKERHVTLSSRHFGRLDEDKYNQDIEDTSSSASGMIPMMYNRKPRSLMDCFEMFTEITKSVNDLKALERITQEALEDFAHHHVGYLELRSTPKRLLYNHLDTQKKATKREYVDTILSVMKEFERQEQKRYNNKNEEQQQQHPNDNTSYSTNSNGQQQQSPNKQRRLPLVPRFIVSIDRSGTVEEGMENAQVALDLWKEQNPFVVGVDLGGNPTRNQFSHFIPVFDKIRSSSSLQITIHCGEVTTTTTTSNNHVVEDEIQSILEYRPDRLGHALLIPESLRPLLVSSKIPVECCPTSNVMTLELATHVDGNLVQGLQHHPQLEDWLRSQYPLSISTDDSGVFHTDPTQEMLLLVMAFPKLVTCSELKTIVMQSLDHAFCSDTVKTRLKETFENHLTT